MDTTCLELVLTPTLRLGARRYVLWHKMGKPGARGSAPDDDAAEGRSSTARDRSDKPQTALSAPQVASAEAATSVHIPAAAESTTPAPEAAAPVATDAAAAAAAATPAAEAKVSHPRSDGQTGEGESEAAPEAKKVRLSGAEKKKAARERQQKEWEAKQAAKQAGGDGNRKKKNGQNHVRWDLTN